MALLYCSATLPFQGPSAFAAEPSPGCEARCKEYKAAKKACEANPGVRSAEIGDCTPAAFESKWGQVAHQCAAMDAAKQAKSGDMVTAVVYTSAAAVCWAACANIFQVSNAACLVAGGVAGGIDMIQSALVGSAVSATMGGLIGAAGGGLATAGLTGASLGTNAASWAKSGSAPCYAGGLLTVMAGLKWYGMSSNQSTADKACQAIVAYGSDRAGAGTGGSFANPGKASGLAGGSAPSAGEANHIDEQAQAAEDVLRGSASAATGGGVMDRIDVKKGLDSLDKLGLSPKSIARGLESSSPSSLLSGMPGMPAGFSDALQKADEAIRAGEIQLNATDSTYSAAGGGAGGGAKASGGGGINPFAGLDFGGAKPDAAAGPGSLDFGANRAPGADGDIWHTGYKGSIFQIVSGKIGQNHHRVEKMEWATPLNRALMGLPALPKP